MVALAHHHIIDRSIELRDAACCILYDMTMHVCRTTGYLFYLRLMLHAWVERFDVMYLRGNILGWDGEVNKATKVCMHGPAGRAAVEACNLTFLPSHS
jgi:hypothetical protein